MTAASREQERVKTRIRRKERQTGGLQGAASRFGKGLAAGALQGLSFNFGDELFAPQLEQLTGDDHFFRNRQEDAPIAYTLGQLLPQALIYKRSGASVINPTQEALASDTLGNLLNHGARASARLLPKAVRNPPTPIRSAILGGLHGAALGAGGAVAEDEDPDRLQEALLTGAIGAGIAGLAPIGLRAGRDAALNLPRLKGRPALNAPFERRLTGSPSDVIARAFGADEALARARAAAPQARSGTFGDFFDTPINRAANVTSAADVPVADNSSAFAALQKGLKNAEGGRSTLGGFGEIDTPFATGGGNVAALTRLANLAPAGRAPLVSASRTESTRLLDNFVRRIDDAPKVRMVPLAHDLLRAVDDFDATGDFIRESARLSKVQKGELGRRILGKINGDLRAAKAALSNGDSQLFDELKQRLAKDGDLSAKLRALGVKPPKNLAQNGDVRRQLALNSADERARFSAEADRDFEEPQSFDRLFPNKKGGFLNPDLSPPAVAPLAQDDAQALARELARLQRVYYPSAPIDNAQPLTRLARQNIGTLRNPLKLTPEEVGTYYAASTPIEIGLDNALHGVYDPTLDDLQDPLRALGLLDQKPKKQARNEARR